MKKKTIEIESSNTLTINRTMNYEGHRIVLKGIDEKRTKEFNEGKTIEVTTEELNAIGEHRWLEVKQV